MSNNLISAELSQQLIKDDCKSFNIRKDDGWKEFVAIVRCKDCEACCINYSWNGTAYYSCAIDGRVVKQDDFCSWGKSKNTLSL